jgi:hypothetical protein
MPVAGRRNHPASELHQPPLDPLPMGLQNLLDKRLIALRIVLARHLAFEVHRADDVGEQDRLELGHTGSEELGARSREKE